MLDFIRYNLEAGCKGNAQPKGVRSNPHTYNSVGWSKSWERLTGYY